MIGRRGAEFVLASTLAAILLVACGDGDANLAQIGNTTSSTPASASAPHDATTGQGAGDEVYLDVSPTVPGETTVPRSDRDKCVVDTRTLRTAEEAHFASKGRYVANQDELVAAGYLSETSRLHNVVVTPSESEMAGRPLGSPQTIDIVIASPICGVVGHKVGQTPIDL